MFTTYGVFRRRRETARKLIQEKQGGNPRLRENIIGLGKRECGVEKGDVIECFRDIG